MTETEGRGWISRPRPFFLSQAYLRSSVVVLRRMLPRGNERPCSPLSKPTPRGPQPNHTRGHAPPRARGNARSRAPRPAATLRPQPHPAATPHARGLRLAR